MNDNIRYLEKAFFLFFVVLVVQIIAESILSGPAQSIYDYKHDMRIPIGGSNALSALIIPFFAYLYCVSSCNLYKILLFATTFVAIALTRSRGGFIDLFVIYSILLIFNGKKNFLVGKFLIIPIGLFLLFYGFWQSDLGMEVFEKGDSTVVRRYDLWESGLTLFKEHPLLGNGFYYDVLAKNPHNVLIDLIMRSGLAGVLVVVFFIIILFTKIRRNIDDKSIRGGLCALLALFVQGLVEIVFFAYIFEIIIWAFVGYLIKKNELLCMKQNRDSYNTFSKSVL